MIENLGNTVAVLASLAAVGAFVLGVTKSARLRRSAAFLQEVLADQEEGPQAAILKSLHRATVAEVVARQMTPVWRLLWPPLAWATMASLAGQAGYLTVRYLDKQPDFAWTSYLVAAFGDTVSPFMALTLVLAMAPGIYVSYAAVLEARARSARRYFDGLAVNRPLTVREEQAARLADATAPDATPPGLGDPVPWGLKAHLHGLGPSLLSVVGGFLIGVNISLQRLSEQRHEELLNELGGWLGLVLLVFSLALTLTIQSVAALRTRLRRFRLPTAHPALDRAAEPDPTELPSEVPPGGRAPGKTPSQEST